MKNTAQAIVIVLLGAIGFLVWHLTSTVSEFETQLSDGGRGDGASTAAGW